MEPIELLQWVILSLLVPGLLWILQLLLKVRGAQVAILNSLMEMQRWHAPQMNKAIETLLEEIRGLRGDFRDVIPPLSEEHRVQDREVAALRAQVAEVRDLVQRRKDD